MDYVILILLTFGITFFIKTKVKLNALSSKDILIGWFIKVFFAIIYLIIFKVYYGSNSIIYGDTYNFMSDSKTLSELAYANPFEYLKLLLGFTNEQSPEVWSYIEQTNIWTFSNNGDFINDNRLILRLNSVIHLFSFGNIYTHTLIHVFISFLGLKFIFQSLNTFVKQKKWFWYTLMLTPSIAFWSGAILKESILVFGIGLLFYSIKLLTKHFSLKGLFFLILSVLSITYNKPYTGLVLFPLSLFLFLGKYYSWKIKPLKISIIIIMLGFVFLMFAPSKINLTNKVSYKQKDLINLGNGGIFFITDSSFCAFDYKYINHFSRVSDSLIIVNKPAKGEYKLFGTLDFKSFSIVPSKTTYPHYLTQKPSTSFYSVKPINNSVVNLVKAIPISFFNVHFRPFPWDNGDKLKIFAFLQNMFLIALFIYSIVNRRKLLNIEKWYAVIIVFSIVFITLLIGWTTPIFGASVRYKVPVDLLVIILSFIFLKIKNHEKI